MRVHRTKSLMQEQSNYQRIIEGAKALYKIMGNSMQREINDQVVGLVFSKDRPLQLHALLSSYFKLVAHAAPLDIIYKASTAEVNEYYRELANEFTGYPIRLIREHHFNEQVIQWCEERDADRIFFLTDDAIFLAEMDLKDCLLFHPVTAIFSPRYGKDLTYCFPFNCNQDLPGFEKEDVTGTQPLLKWRWNDRPGSPDWSYPLSVDFHIFYKYELLAILRNIDFNSPNSLEANIQIFADFFLNRFGVSYSKVKMLNIPCNRVQQELQNRAIETYTVDELLMVWNKGQRININEFYNLSAPEAVFHKYTFYKK